MKPAGGIREAVSRGLVRARQHGRHGSDDETVMIAAQVRQTLSLHFGGVVTRLRVEGRGADSVATLESLFGAIVRGEHDGIDRVVAVAIDEKDIGVISSIAAPDEVLSYLAERVAHGVKWPSSVEGDWVRKIFAWEVG